LLLKGLSINLGVLSDRVGLIEFEVFAV